MKFFAEIVRGPWRHCLLFGPCSRVGHFLFRLRVQLELEGQMPIRYIELRVLCGGTPTSYSGFIQWGSVGIHGCGEDGERLLFGKGDSCGLWGVSVVVQWLLWEVSVVVQWMRASEVVVQLVDLGCVWGS